MSTASSRTLMRLITAAFLLLLRSDAFGGPGTSAHKHHSPHSAIATADYRALLASTPEPKHVDTAPPQLLAPEASVHDGRVQFAPAPTRDSSSLCLYQRATSQAARPPPFQA